MRVLIALVLATGIVMGQGPLIKPAPGAGQKSAAEKEAIDKLVDLLSEQIQDQIPCSRPATMDEIRDMLREAKDKETVGTATGNELAQVLDKVGVRDVVAVNVTQMGGQMLATVLWMDMKTARTNARESAPVSGDDASLDDFAKKFASQMKAQKGSGSGGQCEADKEWYGTVRATITKNDAKDETTSHCTEKSGNSENWQCTVRIPRKGKATAFATVVRKLQSSLRCSCAKGGRQWSTATRTEELMGAANVKVEALFEENDGMLSGGAALDTMPAQLTISGQSTYKDGCTAESNNPESSQTLTTQVIAPSFSLPGQALKPGQRVSRGSYTDKGVKIEWRLTRAGK